MIYISHNDPWLTLARQMQLLPIEAKDPDLAQAWEQAGV